MNYTVKVLDTNQSY